MSGVNWQECMDEAKRRENIQDETDEKVLRLATRLYLHIFKTRTIEDGSRDLRAAQSNAEITMSRTPIMRRSLVGMLEGMIIQAWTAYEVMAVDLIKSLLKRRRSLDTRKTWSPAEKEHSGFGSRSKIANYYRWTFRTDNAAILKNVDSPAVHALGIARNLLVHSAGCIDKSFQTHRLGFYAGIPSLSPLLPIPELNKIRGNSIGYRVNFDGDFVRLLIDKVTPLGFGLVKYVDEWLTTHK